MLSATVSAIAPSSKHALREGLSEAQAADIIWALVTTRTYRALVEERGWTTGQYERWLTDLLTGALLENGSRRDL